ncbi:hypothetical protein, variant [Verruconis gallopava]|uniref:Major facilitator superfamily (MFS) profile domain-containing protein n=1 Tax=Verruconis gallopava TaxID=253628 RepID=A0A0D2A2K2_9PEZI|nr:hypothetical protein, variant [Verruconis gallopava]KIW00575.1 hypothetical protein, variant [Verruconis gallopava]
MLEYDKLLSAKGKHTRLQVDEIDEATPLIGENFEGYRSCGNGQVEPEESAAETTDSPQSGLVGMIVVLLVGVFVSQADGSLVLAAYSKVSSEFGDFENGSWLFSAYVLAMCVTQPLYGKLSDIYGRKTCLQISYMLFALGTACTGLGQSMRQVIAARAVQGAGGAGMVCMVSILLTDLVPLNEVALYRSYVNIAQTVGRSCGGAVGGYIVETLGWRWAFLCQCPVTFIAIGLVAWKLPVSSKSGGTTEAAESKLKRIDWVGAVTLSLTILSALIIVDMGGQKYPFSHPIIISAMVTFAVAGVIFLVTEDRYAKEPIFPLHLLSRYVVVTSYAVLFLQNFAQTALMMIIPIYFQVTKKASTAVAGTYLIPAVFGNTIGGLLTGFFIKRRVSKRPYTLLFTKRS